MACYAGFDSNGCAMQDICVTIPVGTDGKICPGMCPTICGADEIVCDGGTDANGCPGYDLCLNSQGMYPCICNLDATFSLCLFEWLLLGIY